MRIFTFGELWGSAPCRICGKEDYIQLLDDDEERLIEQLEGPRAAAKICSYDIGIPICEDHIPKELIYNE